MNRTPLRPFRCTRIGGNSSEARIIIVNVYFRPELSPRVVQNILQKLSELLRLFPLKFVISLIVFHEYRVFRNRAAIFLANAKVEALRAQRKLRIHHGCNVLVQASLQLRSRTIFCDNDDFSSAFSSLVLIFVANSHLQKVAASVRIDICRRLIGALRDQRKSVQINKLLYFLRI